MPALPSCLALHLVVLCALVPHGCCCRNVFIIHVLLGVCWYAAC
jgi:hypothetical protein